MSQPPGGYPPWEPGRHQPPADPYLGPPSWDPPAPGPPPPASGGRYGAAGRPAPPYDQPPYGQSPYEYSLGPPPEQPPYSGPGGQPGGQPPGPPRRRRGLLFIAIGLAGVLVLCAAGGIGAWYVLGNADRDGAASPVAAVQSFLQAVYRDRDASRAAALVCSEARDEESLQAKINEISAYAETQFGPDFQWTTPELIESSDELAVVAVTVTMITGDEKVADQTLYVSVLDKDPHGWWVCNLETVDAEPAPSGAEDGDAEDGDAEDDGDADDGEPADDGGE